MNLLNVKYYVIIAIIMAVIGKEEINFKVTEQRELQGVASASGLSAIGEDFYVVGDDSPYLFQLDKDLKIIDRIRLMPQIELPDSLYAKAVKPDFEAIATTPSKKKMFIFGSGSKSPQRDVVVEVELLESPVVRSFDLQKFYSALRFKAGLKESELNIEAAEIVNGYLLLFNRGRNMILRYNLEEFYAFLEDNKGIPEPEVFSFTLPGINGIEAGFSGATTHPDGETIIFTATVEDTGNWIDDGEVLGSFLGIIDSSNLKGKSPKKVSATAVKVNEKILPIKVESLAVIGISGERDLELMLVTDSDGDISEALKGRMTW